MTKAKEIFYEYTIGGWRFWSQCWETETAEFEASLVYKFYDSQDYTEKNKTRQKPVLEKKF